MTGFSAPRQSVIVVSPDGSAAAEPFSDGSLPVASGASSALNITVATVVKAAPGRLVRVSVIAAGSAAGTVNDHATTSGVGASNQIGTIPTAVGTTLFDWPCAVGITVVPGTGQTIAVSYT